MIASYISDQAPSLSPERVLDVRLNPSPAFAGAILKEYGLEAITAYASDFKKIVSEAPDFLKIRGTVASIEKALEWVGLSDAKFIRLSNWEYELDPGLRPSELDVKKILAALSISAPARGRLSRIFHGDYERVFS
ncbi:hypothetical protein [Pseudobacteriovorax antillogorgiicola]|uniref:Uncharacterized protein n=1 Tax=Pseudobacteriovorax antillogorgiicola TaxID=1513793 RepID=A0A1Y6CWZ7_9BACT|nr:hypothetical protein [Pseudobacteriovorax antillogorgiicola]TCS44265.1 hypothetical protein EDD56_13465 [Pseudobacteriovorax antillogorgiicola]TCS51643.1 hypothetical protein EDD56_11027 [Pseudobacteriovorax antillogorgiicola]SMF80832.1 hypothetical protein SAMN06296036_13566 [Pseudobacteriovorax antillogorgiicola]SMF81642.1 hypothetical protein SAMN06296036_13727 [Pseudobacteriovorax antillogorgiicola]